MRLRLYNYIPLSGSQYIELPKDIVSKRAVINI